MPPRRQPTARQERLGTELRKLREAAGMTAREAAGLLGTNPIQMSQMESGRAGISEERLRRLASHYACADGQLIDALAAMATERGRGWWEEYRGVLPPAFLDLAELEHHATFLRDLNIVHVPGILQTESYARAVFSYNVPELPASELEPRVAHRMRRRVVVGRESPTEFEAVIHEAALRIRVGDRLIARDQLKHVLDESERPNVTVRVIPFDVDWFSGASSSMIHAGGAVPQLDTVVRDAPHGTAHLDAQSQIARLRVLFRKVEEASLSPAKSRDFIYCLMREV
ncbi:helix-turn-helix domain-containing protein [Streptomyces varsoviensis]|uniref:DNA-binding protein n=1 Tax=Streptomyces varsoviensis TaxID=67373 RepID=A0ABR5J9X0_9ACTN|nr:helix-turn-helix transcriptional regulator [Streptomyces varsoviensis]KOG90177.1 DNA-binding protein [Streptomyces varsoviensis]